MAFQNMNQQPLVLEPVFPYNREFIIKSCMNSQHALLRRLLGYLIHPDILNPRSGLPKDARIADIGTGTGQWLIDVSEELPSAQLDGFDIITSRFPCPAWLPRRMSLSQMDITAAIPQHLKGMYDLVHVQVFLCLVQEQVLPTILNQLFKLLKPGGYLQWVERNPASFNVVSPDPSLKKSACEKFLSVTNRDTNGKFNRWPSQLPVYFQLMGLQLIGFQSYPVPPAMYTPFMECHLTAADEHSLRFLKNDTPNGEGAQFRRLLAEVHQECKSGVFMIDSPIVVIGRKSF